MNDTELQARVRQALERTDIMALSTIDEDGGPWTSPVQYQRDSETLMDPTRSGIHLRSCAPARWAGRAITG
jgi:hypothetical protein